MRVFIVHEDIYHAGNPYIYTLVDSIRSNHPDVEFGWGWDAFWSDEIYTYDIVHFQWPQAFMSYVPEGEAATKLEHRLIELKAHGVRIVATCHDLKPHYSQCVGYGQCLDLAYQYADMIFHLGEYSCKLFKEQYPQAKHVVIYHHVYDTIYTERPSSEESRKYLNIPSDKLCILCFGMFRSQEERDLVLNLARRLRKEKLSFTILAPAFMKVKSLYRWKWKLIPNMQIFKYLYYRYVLNIRMTGKTWVPVEDNELPYYYGASDMALVHRRSILNSGNAVLPLLFDVPVVGPNVGNVGPFLKEFGYPSFDVNDDESIVNAVKEAIEMKEMQYPQKHHTDMMDKLATDVVSKRIYHEYCKILKS